MGFYKDKKVLVAGGTGLIGKPLVEMLLKQGAIVRIASLDDPLKASKNAEFLRLDLTDFNNCMTACKDMDFVFNLLCIKGNPKIMKEKPASIFEPMILFNTNLLRAAKKSDAKRFLYSSTLGVYPPAEIFYEDSVWNGFPSKNDWYAGWAKRMGELQAEAYEKEYGFDKISIVRPANTYGPYDDFDSENSMVIPSLIKRAFSGENPMIVWGDGSSIRDFVHSNDVARGMMLALEKGISPRFPINLGSGKGYSIQELLDCILNNFDNRPDVLWDTTKPSGDKKRVLDIKRAKELLDWEPEISLKQGIKEVIEWYKENKKA
jgi:GDP-L-fucose synthase